MRPAAKWSPTTSGSASRWRLMACPLISSRRSASGGRMLTRPRSWPRTGARRALIEAYVAAGISKFVIRPAATPAPLGPFIEDFAREMLPLQT